MGLHFSQEEFKSRKSKVLISMKEQKIDYDSTNGAFQHDDAPNFDTF